MEVKAPGPAFERTPNSKHQSGIPGSNRFLELGRLGHKPIYQSRVSWILRESNPPDAPIKSRVAHHCALGSIRCLQKDSNLRQRGKSPVHRHNALETKLVTGSYPRRPASFLAINYSVVTGSLRGAHLERMTRIELAESSLATRFSALEIHPRFVMITSIGTI